MMYGSNLPHHLEICIQVCVQTQAIQRYGVDNKELARQAHEQTDGQAEAT